MAPLSISWMILYGASQRALPEAVLVSLMSQFTITSVSTKIFGGAKDYSLILPYRDFLSSLIDSEADFSGGRSPSYFPRSSSEILAGVREARVRPLREFIKSLSVAGIVLLSFCCRTLAKVTPIRQTVHFSAVDGVGNIKLAQAKRPREGRCRGNSLWLPGICPIGVAERLKNLKVSAAFFVWWYAELLDDVVWRGL
jgi:hypothetical protein